MKRITVISIAAIVASSSMAMADFDARYNHADSRIVGQSIKIVWAAAGTHIDQTSGLEVAHAANDLIGNFSAGHLAYDYTNGTDGSADGGHGQYESGQFSGFCIELQSIQGGNHTYTVDQISNAPNPDGPTGDPMNDPLFGGPAYDAADQAEVEAVIAAAVRKGWLNNDLSATGSVTDTQLAAIQGLIWSRLFDNTIVTGRDAGVAAAMAVLETEVALDTTATMPNLRAMMNADTQDQLYVIPLPTAVYAGLLTLGGLAGFSRIRRR